MDICPKDRSDVVFLAGRSRGSSGPFVTYLFCPVCSTGFAVWGKLPTEEPAPPVVEHVRSWTYRDGRLEPGSESPPEPTWDSPYLRERIACFVQGRDEFGGYCFIDGSKAALIGDFGDMKFVWCASCQRGFAYYRRPLYGWPIVGSFGRDAGRKGYVAVEVLAPEALRGRFETGLTRLRI